jgi:hypothetical protein
MNGYVGRYIWLHGKDLHGNTWPLFYFDNFGDYPNVLPMYLSGLSTFVWGVNEFGVRFPIALAGALTVFPLYALGRLVFLRRSSALWLAGFLAVLPWHIVLSRATAEAVTASLVFFTALALLLWGIRQRAWWMYTSVPLFLLTYLLYPGFRVFVPAAVLMPVLAIPNFRKHGLLILAIMVTVTLLISQTVWGKGRFNQTSIFYHNREVADRMAQYTAALGPGKVLEARIFHNKLVGYSREAIHQYLSYVSPTFLLSRGGKPPRYLVPDHGLLYVTFLVALLVLFAQKLGRLPLGKENEVLDVKNIPFWWTLLGILLVAPLPAVLTLDDVPNVHRALQFGIMLLFPITYVWESLKGWKLAFVPITAVLTGFLVLEAAYFWHQYSALFDQTAAIYRNDDQRTLSKLLPGYQARYQRVLVPSVGGQPIFTLFYTNNFSEEHIGRFESGLYIPTVDTIEFTLGPCTTAFLPYFDITPDQSVLFIDKSECDLPDEFKVVGEVQRVGETDAYRILELIATRSASLQ